MKNTSAIFLAAMITIVSLNAFSKQNQFNIGDVVVYRDDFETLKGTVIESDSSGELHIDFDNPTDNAFYGNQNDASHLSPYQHTGTLVVTEGTFSNETFTLTPGARSYLQGLSDLVQRPSHRLRQKRYDQSRFWKRVQEPHLWTNF